MTNKKEREKKNKYIKERECRTRKQNTITTISKKKNK